MIRSLKGMPDHLPEESARWQAMEEIIRSQMHSYAYEEIRTPLLEETELFSRSIGASTDVVEKEMYTMETKGGESVTLRPEGTASVVRSFIENHLGQSSDFLRLYYLGPMFRHERPQKGRLRQFHQLGIEAMGQSDALADVEVITVAMKLLERFSIQGLKLEINSVGDPACRPAYRKKLEKFLLGNESSLSEDARKRIQSNPLRVLDSKDPKNSETIKAAPKLLDHLCEDCSMHFNQVQEGLKTLGIDFSINPRIVRGLDYYTRTSFEISAGQLGAQNAIMGGGRYDGLIEEMGGKSTPAVGFGMGLERLLLASENWSSKKTGQHIAFLALKKEFRLKTLELAEKLRSASQVPAKDARENALIETILHKDSLKSGLRFANRRGASKVIILGENEMAKGVVMVKNLAEKTQEEVAFKDIGEILD